MSRTIDVDYVVVGAGAMGMAFTDALLTESDATVAIVDRYEKPGGHWTRAYSFVRLHQPSAFYGVNSRELGNGRKDERGGNAGLHELASASDVVAYLDAVMRQQFLPTRRVQYFPMSEYADGSVTSLVSGATTPVRAGKVVDVAHAPVSVPSMRPAPYEVEPGALCVPPNALAAIDGPADDYVVVGAGKTGIDTVLWLLDAGVPQERIRWIRPRDAWLLDRATIQPGAEAFESTVGGRALQLEAAARATSIGDLFERLEATGQLLRIDPAVRPSVYRCATVTRAELAKLRTVRNVVRKGHVRRITSSEIVLDEGTIPATERTLAIDCTADGLGVSSTAPVFAGDRIALQNIRLCQPTLSAAFIGHIEAAYNGEAEKNKICRPIAYPERDTDWLRVMRDDLLTTSLWRNDKDLRAWMRTSRLDPYSSVRFDGAPTEQQAATLARIAEYAPLAIENLTHLMQALTQEHAAAA